jgi:hypothetical protein
MDIFDSYSSRSGEIFLTEIYKYSKEINSQNTSQSILFMCSEVWNESAEISEGNVDVSSNIEAVRTPFLGRRRAEQGRRIIISIG